MPFSEETHDAAAAARLRMEKENILQQLLIFFFPWLHISVSVWLGRKVMQNSLSFSSSLSVMREVTYDPEKAAARRAY